MWFSNSSLLCKTIPRNGQSPTVVRSVPFKNMGSCESVLVLFVNRVTWVFSVLVVNRLVIDHLEKISSWWFTLSMRHANSWCFSQSVVSSAKSIVSELSEREVTWLIHNKNNKSPRVDLCGNSHNKDLRLDKMLPILTAWRRVGFSNSSRLIAKLDF